MKPRRDTETIVSAGPDVPASPGPTPSRAPETAEAPQGPALGSKIGRYTVLRRLGAGGMGVVYAVLDESLGRQIAVKVLHEHIAAGPRGVARVMREAQALARLSHPNVVAIHDVATSELGLHIAMEYVTGVTMRTWLAERPRSPAEILAVFEQAGRGLAAAHAVGLVHRDFKPDNVMIDAEGRVRVMDFGLARSFVDADPAGEHDDRAEALHTLRFAGTSAYMAPEQRAGFAVDARADLYSFCVALHEALVGKRPPVADDDAAGLPAWLRTVLRRGLAADPAERWPAIPALLAALARDPVVARRRALRQAALLLFVVGVTITGVLGALEWRQAAARQVAESRAHERLEQLRARLAEPGVRADAGEALRLFRAFVENPDNRGTTALSRAYREWGARLSEPAAVVDALADAYLTAAERNDEIAALRDLTAALFTVGRPLEAGNALATLDALAPDLAQDPALASDRVTATLRRRDLGAARAALTLLPAGHPSRTYENVLKHMVNGTFIDEARFGHHDPNFRDFAPADIDGDGRVEFGTSAPAVAPDALTVVRSDAALSLVGVFRTGAPIEVWVRPLPHSFAGAPMVLFASPREDPVFSRRVVLAELLADGRAVERFAWDDSQPCRPAAADLDGDGVQELYVGSLAYARRLSRIDRGPEGWRRSQAMAEVDQLDSDIINLVAGDLDGDGRDELVVAIGPWNAFELRVLRGGPDGALTRVARRTIGMLDGLELVRVGGETLVAATKHNEYTSLDGGRFLPAGLHLFALRGAELVVVASFPVATDPALLAFRAPMQVADLDGDGLDDIVVRAQTRDSGRFGPIFGLAVFRQHAGELLPPLVLEGLDPLAVAELDGDPPAEVLAVTAAGDPEDYLVLGLGDTPVAPAAVPREEPRPLPVRVDDPTIAAAWDRAEALAAVGLPQRSAAELSQSSRLAGHARHDMVFRAAELFALAGDHAAAAEHFVVAGERPELAAAALAGAIRSRHALGEVDAEVELAARRAALPDLEPGARAAAESELVALRRAAGPRPRVALRFDAPLAPQWRLDDPLALARDPGTGALDLHTASRGVIATLPLRHDGGSASLMVEFEVEMAEWGSQFDVSVGGDEPLLDVRLRGHRGVDAPQLRIEERREMVVVDLPGPPAGRIRFRDTIYPDLDLETVALELPGQAPLRSTRALDGRALPRETRLELRGTSRDPSLLGSLKIHAIELEGLELGDVAAPGPADTVVRRIVEGELVAALAGLPATAELHPGDIRLLWRADLLARLGRLEEAAAAIRRALEDVPEDSEIRDAVKLRVRADRGPLRLALARALGPRRVDLLYNVSTLSHPWRPEDVAGALADLAVWPHAAAADAGADELADHVLALLVRSVAWRRFGRLDLACADLDAATRVAPETLTRPLRDKLQDLQLTAALAAGDPARAFTWAEAMIRDSPFPEIQLERLRSRPGLDALLRPEHWDALARQGAR